MYTKKQSIQPSISPNISFNNSQSRGLNLCIFAFHIVARRCAINNPLSAPSSSSEVGGLPHTQTHFVWPHKWVTPFCLGSSCSRECFCVRATQQPFFACTLFESTHTLLAVNALCLSFYVWNPVALLDPTSLDYISLANDFHPIRSGKNDLRAARLARRSLVE